MVSWGVHYGISTQKWQSLRDEFKEFKTSVTSEMDKFKIQLTNVEKSLSDKMSDIEHGLAMHTTNSDIHVNPTLLQLFNERSDYIKQQFSDTRNDIQRLENMLASNK